MGFLMFALFSSCSSGDGTSESTTMDTSVTSGDVTDVSVYEAPVMAAVAASLGADLTDIYKAVLARREQDVAECMQASGWPISSDELGALFDTGESVDGSLSAYIDSLISALAPTTSTSDTQPQSRTRTNQLLTCMDQAETDFRNPNDVVLTAIADFDSEVSARVAADRRVQDAKSVRDECAENAGLPSDSQGEPMAVLSNMVAEVQVSQLNGATSSDQAKGELRNLRALAVSVEDCYHSYELETQSVVDEVQTAVLKSRPELIPSIVEQTSELMTLYRALLDNQS